LNNYICENCSKRYTSRLKISKACSKKCYKVLYYSKNRIKILKKRKDDLKRFGKSEKTKENQWKHHLIVKYGVTVSEYKGMLFERKNRCDICNKKLKKPYIDHNHKTGKIRGVLCYGCNTSLGKFGDDIKGLNKAIKYLERTQHV